MPYSSFSRRRRAPGGPRPSLALLPLAATLSVVLFTAGLHGRTSAGGADMERGRFSPCAEPARVTCVVDGDTFWYRGEKIRIADVNTPEVGTPGCPAEARLGRAASRRLEQLLNAGPFTLAPTERASDRYGRSLRVVTRGGESLGEMLTVEGLAEPWRGRRGNWC